MKHRGRSRRVGWVGGRRRRRGRGTQPSHNLSSGASEIEYAPLTQCLSPETCEGPFTRPDRALSATTDTSPPSKRRLAARSKSSSPRLHSKQKRPAEGAFCRPNECSLLQPPFLATFEACGPFHPLTISNSTGSPSCSVPYPSPEMSAS